MLPSVKLAPAWLLNVAPVFRFTSFGLTHASVPRLLKLRALKVTVPPAASAPLAPAPSIVLPVPAPLIVPLNQLSVPLTVSAPTPPSVPVSSVSTGVVLVAFRFNVPPATLMKPGLNVPLPCASVAVPPVTVIEAGFSAPVGVRVAVPPSTFSAPVRL